MTTSYETDVVEWAKEQANLIRAGRFDLLDLDHIAEEIEDVGKSEKRELASRMVVLLAHLLKWKFQPQLQCKSWQRTIAVQRKDIHYALDEAPSLRASLADEKWLDLVWSKSVVAASNETGLDDFPGACPWAMEAEILNEDWLPD